MISILFFSPWLSPCNRVIKSHREEMDERGLPGIETSRFPVWSDFRPSGCTSCRILTMSGICLHPCRSPDSQSTAAPSCLSQWAFPLTKKGDKNLQNISSVKNVILLRLTFLLVNKSSDSHHRKPWVGVRKLSLQEMKERKPIVCETIRTYQHGLPEVEKL